MAFKRYGFLWNTDFDGWISNNGRFTIKVWRFGSIYQCNVFVEYEYGTQFWGSITPATPAVRFCLPSSEKWYQAMKVGTSFVARIEKYGFPDSSKVFDYLCDKYRCLYQYRLDILNYLFCVGGYDWLDGQLVDTSLFYKQKSDLDDFDLSFEKGPLKDNGMNYSFHPLSKYSNIINVPDDVNDDWLKLAYETAILLRDRSNLEDTRENMQQTKNRERSFGIIRDLKHRFGSRLLAMNVLDTGVWM